MAAVAEVEVVVVGAAATAVAAAGVTKRELRTSLLIGPWAETLPFVASLKLCIAHPAYDATGAGAAGGVSVAWAVRLPFRKSRRKTFAGGFRSPQTKPKSPSTLSM